MTAKVDVPTPAAAAAPGPPAEEEDGRRRWNGGGFGSSGFQYFLNQPKRMLSRTTSLSARTSSTPPLSLAFPVFLSGLWGRRPAARGRGAATVPQLRQGRRTAVPLECSLCNGVEGRKQNFIDSQNKDAVIIGNAAIIGSIL